MDRIERELSLFYKKEAKIPIGWIKGRKIKKN